MTFICFVGLVFFKKEKSLLYIHVPQSYCLKQNSKITLHGFDAHSKPDVFKMFL